MNHRNRIIQTYGLWFIDMLCIALSYFIATQLRFASARDYGSKTLHYMVLVIFLLFCTVYSYFVDWNRSLLKRGVFQEFMAVLKFNAVMIIISMTFVFFAQWAYILSRSVILNFAWINLVLMLAAHQIYKIFLHRLFSSASLVTKVLLVAGADSMDAAAQRLGRTMGEGYQIVGTVTVADLKENTLRKITEKMTQIPFDEVLICTPQASLEETAPLIEGFEEMGVVCHLVLDLPEYGDAITSVGKFGNYTVLTYSRFRSSYKKLLIKRAFDILGSLIGLALTGIITVFLAPAIKLDSPGSVFFSQVRVGKNGRRFKIYKFRSMYQDAEERLKDLQSQNEVEGLMFKMENDPRITKVGRFIRKTSLDEFPQFLNILKGDMSLVGTRPPTEREFEQYDEHYRRRLSMTPGLTGLWQVSGRSDIDNFDDVVKLDLQYIDNWSLSLDFKILLQTVGVVLFHKGAK